MAQNLKMKIVQCSIIEFSSKPELIEIKGDTFAEKLQYICSFNEIADTNYLHDINICQEFAKRNREKMAEILLGKTGLCDLGSFQTIHNYIDVNEKILRKGSVSAKSGEKLLIPINMRDGSLICVGKGNDEWNQSAPHGAGRLMSRTAAFERLTMEEYEKQMAGIYTTCVNSATLDESPMAYKNMDEIVANIEPTAEIIARIKPIYNFKAAE